MTRSLEIITASATEATITIAVAADSPPVKVRNARKSCPAESGRAST